MTLSMGNEKTSHSSVHDYYRPGSSLRLAVQHEGGIPLTLTTEVTIIRVIVPATLSVVLEVIAKRQSGTEYKAILKLFDRRFARSLRKLYRVPPWSPAVEKSYEQFIMDMRAKRLFDQLEQPEDDEEDTEKETGKDSMLSEDQAADEGFLQYQTRKIYSNEVRAYDKLKDLQGDVVPTFLAAVELLPEEPWRSAALQEYSSIVGILIEHIEGFNLVDLKNMVPRHCWQAIGDEVIRVVNHVSDLDFINNDVRPGNFIVKETGQEGTYKIVQIDFGQVYFRDGASWEEWRDRKWAFDEEGAIGSAMEDLLGGGFKYTKSCKFNLDLVEPEAPDISEKARGGVRLHAH